MVVVALCDETKTTAGAGSGLTQLQGLSVLLTRTASGGRVSETQQSHRGPKGRESKASSRKSVCKASKARQGQEVGEMLQIYQNNSDAISRACHKARASSQTSVVG